MHITLKRQNNSAGTGKFLAIFAIIGVILGYVFWRSMKDAS